MSSLRKKITIHGIARLAGVSSTTVSRVINGQNKVSDKMRAKIQKIIEDFDFYPSSIAQRMSGKVDKTISILISRESLEFFQYSTTNHAELIRLLISSASMKGFRVLITPTDQNYPKIPEYHKLIEENAVFGFILLDPIKNDERIKYFERINTPLVVLVSSTIQSDNIYYVANDDLYGGELATQYLIDQGRKSVYYFGPPSYMESAALRIDGFKNVLKRNQYEDIEGHIFVVEREQQEKSGYKQMKKFIQTGKRIDAVFCNGDLRALGVIKALSEANIKIPDEVAVIGFDNLEFSNYFSPIPLTTVYQPIQQLAEEAITLFKSLQDGNIVPDHALLLKPKLVLRKSA